MSEGEPVIDDESLTEEDDEERLERELDAWGFFGGRTPDSIASTLDMLRGVLPPASARDRERASQRFFDGLEERLSRRGPTPDDISNLADLVLDHVDDEEDDDEIASFAQASLPAPVSASVSSSASASAPTVPWAQAEEGTGMRQSTVDDAPAATPPVAAAEATDAAGAGAGVRKPPPAWVATTPSMDLSAAARALVPATPRANTPVAVLGPPKGFGHTLPLENPLGEIVAAVQAGAGRAPENKNAAGAGATAGGAPSVEEWTVESYASLSVELRLDPDREAVLERYHVHGEAALATLVEHWNDRMAREPGLKAAVDAAKIAYTVWWSANRMGRGQ